MKVLSISPFDEDHRDLRKILRNTSWQQHDALTLADAFEFLRHDVTAVAICESHLPDGTWKDVLSRLSLMEYTPALVVTSRWADEALWSEVLHLGGYNVLAKPLESQEVLHVVSHACLLWKSRQEGSLQYAQSV